MKTPNDPTRCSARVSDPALRFGRKQCSHKGIVRIGNDLYCNVHDPVRVKKREDKRNAEYEHQRKKDKHRLESTCACRGMKDQIEEVRVLKHILERAKILIAAEDTGDNEAVLRARSGLEQVVDEHQWILDGKPKGEKP